MVFDFMYKGVGIYYDIWGGVRCTLNDAVFDNMNAVKKYIDKVERKEPKQPVLEDPAQLKLFR
jgi:hypothetical protein